MMRAAAVPAASALALLTMGALSGGNDDAVRDDAHANVFALSAGAGRDTLIVPPGAVRTCLSNAPLFVGSLVLVDLGEIEAPLLLGVAYSVDENSGCIELFEASSDTTRLLATYRHLSISGALRRRLHEPRSIDATEPDVLAIPESDADDTEDGRLSVGGSKTFVVEVGSNRDATLTQSLDLTLRGRITREVELNAVLSDRDSPITPEGTSSELEELDEVFIQLTSPQGEATFGDIEITESEGEFARYQRRLEGASARRTGEHLEIAALAASSRGLFRSVEFFGEEGKQGPYRLGEIAGGLSVGIVPGSEAVFVDGERLQRGQDRDYIIDYSLGRLTFTPGRPMTFDSRITVDFEEESEDYRRRFTSAETAYHEGEKLRVRGFVVAEADDRSSPRGFALGEDERALLEGLGDEPPVGESVAARFVGAGNGDYVVVAADSLAPEHFEWRGEGLGDYLVSFVRLGADLGSYADSVLAGGETIYRFVGAGAGDFEPGRRLVSPERVAVGDMIVEWRDEHVTASGEIAASSRDRNTFSPLDDADNDGLAANGEISIRGPTWADGRGGVRWEGHFRHIGRDFSGLSRLVTPFDFLAWNYEPGSLAEGEDRRSMTLEVDPGAGGRLSLEGATLGSGNVFSGERVAIGYTRSGRVRSGARWERTWTEERPRARRGLREVRRAEVSVPFGFVTPGVRVRTELNRTSADTTFSGTRFAEIGGSAQVRPPGPLALTIDFTRRVDDRRERRVGDEWDRDSTTRDRGVRVELSRWHGVRGNAEYRRRTRESRGASPSRTTNLARLGVEADPLQRALRVLVDYQVTTESVFPREKVITFVGDGRGNYDSLGVFVGVGDYDVEVIQSDETELLSRLDLAVRASFTGRTEPDAPPIMRQLRASSFVRIRQSTRRAFEDLVNPFSGDLFSTGREIVDGSVTIREEATLFPASVVSPRVRWERTRFVDGRFDNVRDLRESDVVALLLRGAPARGVTLEVEASTEERADVVERLEPTFARDEERFATRGVRAELTQKPSSEWTLAIGGVLARTTRPEFEGAERRRELTPRATWTPGRQGRIEGSVRWVVLIDPLARRRPTFGFGLENAGGVEWSVVADHRLKDYLTLAGTLRAVRAEGEDSLYDGRIELRAYF